MRVLPAFLLMVFLAMPATAGVPEDSVFVATGNLRVDLLALGEAAPDEPALNFLSGPRNPLLAGGLSLAVPGLGQAYNGSWVRMVLAAGLEAALWTGYFTWQAQGRDGRDAYQAFAHAEWNPYQYAAWLENYGGCTGCSIDFGIAAGIDWRHPERWTGDESRRVTLFFDEIRRAEGQARYLETGAVFSHVLPYFSEQQYYELIGKYYQYNPGWRDWPLDDQGNPQQIGLPTRLDGTTPLFQQYARDHKAANDYFRRASRLTSFIVANHVLAAVDAALTAKFFNRRVSTEMAVGEDAHGYVVPTATLRVRF